MLCEIDIKLSRVPEKCLIIRLGVGVVSLLLFQVAFI